MANHYGYLEGGPCDGKRRKLTTAEYHEHALICNDYLYHTLTPVTHRRNGDLIFKFTGEQNVVSTSVKAAHAHGGYADIRHSVNHIMPGVLANIHAYNRAAQQHIAKASRVHL